VARPLDGVYVTAPTRAPNMIGFRSIVHRDGESPAVAGGCTYCRSVDEFAVTVIGSVAGVLGTAVAIVFGLLPLLRSHRDRQGIPPVSGESENAVVTVPGEKDVRVVVGRIPQEPVAFQSRAKLLGELNDPGSSRRMVVVRAVTGMRGVGKTHLAAEYARTRLTERWRMVAWVNAETADELLTGLGETAAALGLTTEDRQASGLAVRHWLESDGERCLLVFDNATDPAMLRPFLPAAGAAQVIVTSNELSVGELGAGVPVEVFTENEALAFLAERTGADDVRGAQALAAELGYLPLALAQAAAVISGQRLDYGTYLGRLRALPTQELLRPEAAGQYPRSVAATVLLSVEAMRATDDTGIAGAAMELLAVLSAAGVRRSMLYAAGRLGALDEDEQAADVVDRALARLAGGSLLAFSVDGTSVVAHRLVMRVTREQSAAHGRLPSTCAAAGRLLNELADFYDQSWHENRAAVRDLVEQIMALYNSSAACQDDPVVARLMIQLRWSAVFFLNRLKDSAAQVMEIAEPLLADQERVLGGDHPHTLRTRHSLGLAYRDAGRLSEAVQLFERTLADREQVLGGEHPDTLRARSSLAVTYRRAGRLAEAVQLFERTLADREQVLGGDHPDTLITRNSLAIAYRKAGRTTEAIELHKQNLAHRERVLGDDHPDTLVTRNSLAVAYRDAGRTAEAIELHKQNLAHRERALGDNHPDTLTSRNSLAVAYRDAGQLTEAVQLLERTLADRERLLGGDHPDTMRTRQNLGLAYQDAGRVAEAVQLFERTLADRERILGPDHPDTLASQNSLANGYQEVGGANTTPPNRRLWGLRGRPSP
jgi:tetratricopeptide (TPR) repeat protein